MNATDPANAADSAAGPDATVATDPAGQMTVLDLISDAPAPDPSRDRGAVQRHHSGDGANIITFSFAPGQSWPDHEAAHPITVQCLAGALDFTVGERTVRLDPGVIVHLPAHVRHAVAAPADAGEPVNLLLLTMLT